MVAKSPAVLSCQTCQSDWVGSTRLPAKKPPSAAAAKVEKRLVGLFQLAGLVCAAQRNVQFDSPMCGETDLARNGKVEVDLVVSPIPTGGVDLTSRTGPAMPSVRVIGDHPPVLRKPG